MGLRLSYWTLFDGNAFQNYERLEDVVFQPTLTLYHDHTTSKGSRRVFYEGSFFLFQDFTDRQFHHHSAGIAGEEAVGENGPVLQYGVIGGRRFNQPLYDYYDYYCGSGHLHLRFEGSTRGSWILGIRARYQHYDLLQEFRFWEAGAHVQRSYYFQSKTTIIGRMHLGFKKFTESSIREDVVVETVYVGNQGKGRDKGKGKGRDDDGPDEGGRQSDEVLMDEVNRTVQIESPREGVVQWISSLRLAQSLGRRTGIAVEGIVQRIPDGGSRVISGQDSGYETDDDLFDDPYSYDSDALMIELTQLLPLRIQVKVGCEMQEKRYDRKAYDLDNNPVGGMLRVDNRTEWWITLRKTIPSKTVLRSFNLFFNYASIENESNDAYFDYTDRVSSFGLTLSL